MSSPHPPALSTSSSLTAFAQRKAHVLSSVDLSPKGSIDAPIIPLIELLNSHDSIVTTSSCSGRISVFLDGELSKTGKGGGGRWLFVSHDPIDVAEAVEKVWTQMYTGQGSATGRRFLHFKFEPMLLHIQAADLSISQRLLSTALSSGFRESGILNSTSFPMLAIRTQSLSLDCIIGVYDESINNIRSLVDRSYVEMLMEIGNERMAENQKKMQRLHTEIDAGINNGEETKHKGRGKKGSDWEDAEARKKRLREEGLKRQEEIRKQREAAQSQSDHHNSSNSEE